MKTVAVTVVALVLGARADTTPEACRSDSLVQKRSGLVKTPLGSVPLATTKATMESWLAGLNKHAEMHRPLLASDVHMVVDSHNHDRPVDYDGVDDVLVFMEEYKDVSQVRGFISSDGGAFATEVHTFLKMGVSIYDVNAHGKIYSIRTWMGTFKDDKADLWEDGMQNLTDMSGKILDNVTSALQKAQKSGKAKSGKAKSGKAKSRKAKKETNEALMAVLKKPIAELPSRELAACASKSSLTAEQTERLAKLSEKVNALDMDPVIARLVKKEDYEATDAKRVVEEYRKYLIMVGMGANPVPSTQVDDAWHAHILYTKKYEKDCKAVFGHMLHHDPANLLLDHEGQKQQKTKMANKYGDTQQKLCDFFGGFEPVIWAQESVGSCGCLCACACGCSCGCACWTEPLDDTDNSDNSGC